MDGKGAGDDEDRCMNMLIPLDFYYRSDQLDECFFYPLSSPSVVHTFRKHSLHYSVNSRFGILSTGSLFTGDMTLTMGMKFNIFN